jgi:hypothetical protein
MATEIKTPIIATEIKTVRTRRTWFDKLKLWPRAYMTKIRDKGHEVTGRGATREESQKAAEKEWVKEDTE